MALTNLKFSGHDSFHCRPFWLKKGYDFVKKGQSFSDKSGIELGVGRNMVNSIRFWMKSFELVDDNDSLTALADNLFNDDGWDPYLEDEASLWLLHYKLCSKNYSSTYNLIFTNLRKVRPEFSKKHFISQVNEMDTSQSTKIVEKDFSVFTRTYYAKPSKKDIEDSYSGLLTELNLVSEVGKTEENDTLYNVTNSSQHKVAWQVVLFCILDNPNYGQSISITDLFSNESGVGNIFAMTQEGLELKLIEIAENVKNITYTNDAGLKVLQMKGEVDEMKILEDYYAY